MTLFRTSPEELETIATAMRESANDSSESSEVRVRMVRDSADISFKWDKKPLDN